MVFLPLCATFIKLHGVSTHDDFEKLHGVSTHDEFTNFENDLQNIGQNLLYANSPNSTSQISCS